VHDIETVGAGGFYTTYVADFAVNLVGQADDVVDGKPLDEAREDAYHDIFWERRAEAAEG
jgi:hypothetical protein